ncbi:MAG: hypothetical protein WC443_08010 [Desulfobaccales bacterium]
MESTEKISWLWPFKGGSRKERRIALAYALELALGFAAIYYLSWALAPYF